MDAAETNAVSLIANRQAALVLWSLRPHLAPLGAMAQFSDASGPATVGALAIVRLGGHV